MESRQEHEWLDENIVRYYRRKVRNLSDQTMQDVGERRRLRLELQERCGLTELEAINILNGFHIESYIRKYEIRAGKVKIQVDEKELLKRQKKLKELEREDLEDRFGRLLEVDERG